MALQVQVKVVCLMYISPCSISIWAFCIEITKLKCLEKEFLVIQRIVSKRFSRNRECQRKSMYVLDEFWNII